MSSLMGEFAFIEWLRHQTPTNPRLLIGPGDDCAALLLSSERAALITTDMLMEGTRFRLAEAGPRLVGRKAMAVNLSDIAAMAGRPVAAVVSVALPRERPFDRRGSVSRTARRRRWLRYSDRGRRHQ